MLRNYSDISQNELIKEYYKKKERLENNLKKISLIVEAFEEKSNLITEEIRLQEFIKNSHLQASIQHQDNIKLARETEYLEERLKIIEKRQQIELGLLEKKFQWQYGVKQLHKKYNISLENLKLDNNVENNNINTYQQKFNLSKDTISWDHPPFNTSNPNYNSLNTPTKKILESVNICNVEIPPVNNIDDIEDPSQSHSASINLVTNVSSEVEQHPPVISSVIETETRTGTKTEANSIVVEPTLTPVISVPTSKVSNTNNSVKGSINSNKSKSPIKNDFRSDNESLEEQLRHAFQNKFSHLKENSDSDSSDEF